MNDKIRGFAPANPKNFCLLKTAPLPGYTMLIDSGEIASQGVGTGAVFPVHQIEDLTRFPAGGVLVARHSSPELKQRKSRCFQAVETPWGDQIF